MILNIDELRNHQLNWWLLIYKKNKFGKVQYTKHLKKHNKYSVKL